MSARYSYSTTALLSPYSELGADVPGFPVGYYANTNLGVLTETQTFSPQTILTANVSYFQNYILLDKRLSGFCPQAFSFGYASTWPTATGAPLIMTQGFSNVGDPIINPRDTTQDDYAFSTNVAHRANMYQLRRAVSPDADQRLPVKICFRHLFFHGQGYTNNALANFLLGRPDIFTQTGGDFTRDLRGWELGAYAQDEYRLGPRLTLNYGLRYEITTPFSDIHNRLMAFEPGKQSVVHAAAPNGLLFPGDRGVPDTIASIFRATSRLVWALRGTRAATAVP